MRVKRLMPVLEDLAARSSCRMVAGLEAAPKPHDVFAGKRFDLDAQWAFTLRAARGDGLRPRGGPAGQERAPLHRRHAPAPTCASPPACSPSTPLPAIFGAIHEGGHGLYEQGFATAHSRTTLAQAPSMGLHESQSRLWENLVGRSRPFWTALLPAAAAALPRGAGRRRRSTDFLRAVNRVERTFIRVEADEVTYNLHIVLRYRARARAVARRRSRRRTSEAAWNEKTKALLGLEP